MVVLAQLAAFPPDCHVTPKRALAPSWPDGWPCLLLALGLSQSTLSSSLRRSSLRWQALGPRFCSLCLCSTVGCLLLYAPTAGPHQRCVSLYLPSCLASFLSHLCLHLGVSCRTHDRYHAPPWHKHGLPWNKSCLHVGSADMPGKVLCSPCSLLPMCPLPWE